MGEAIKLDGKRYIESDINKSPAVRKMRNVKIGIISIKRDIINVMLDNPVTIQPIKKSLKLVFTKGSLLVRNSLLENDINSYMIEIMSKEIKIIKIGWNCITQICTFGFQAIL